MANVERPKPSIGIDSAGKITWNPIIAEFNREQWYRGKVLSNDEFNNLWEQQVRQGNYTADSLVAILGEHLNTSIKRTFQTDYQVIPSYTKIFTSEMWQGPDSEGYYSISILSTEHLFEPLDESNFLEGFNIDVDMYLLIDGKFCQVQQYNIQQGNAVTLYSDTNEVPGYVVIRSNDRSYSLSGSNISAEFISGLAPVATTNLYTDLAARPDDQINSNTSRITELEKILNPANPTTVSVAEYAKTLDDNSKINNIKISDIFEMGTNCVKFATRAEIADNYYNNGMIAREFRTLSEQITRNAAQQNDLISVLNNQVVNNYNTLNTNIERIINGTTTVSKAVTATSATQTQSTPKPVLLYDGQNKDSTNESTITCKESWANYHTLIFVGKYITLDPENKNVIVKEYVTQCVPTSFLDNPWEYEVPYICLRAFTTDTSRYITLCEGSATGKKTFYIKQVKNMSLAAVYGIK